MSDQAYQQQPKQQQQYQPSQQIYMPQQSQPSSTGSWFLVLLVTAIPIVGLIMLFVWGFGNPADESRKNWAKAQLLWMLIAVIVCVILAIIAALLGITFEGGWPTF